MKIEIAGTPEEVVSFLKYFCGDCASYITEDDIAPVNVETGQYSSSLEDGAVDSYAPVALTFYNAFLKLCAAKGESPSRVAKKIGLSNAAASGWKNGKTPSQVTLVKLANYFDVTPDFLLWGNEESVQRDSVIDRINLRLTEIGMSGAELARELGLSNSIYSQWNTGKTQPSKKTLVRIAKCLDIPIQELIPQSKKSKGVNT